MLLQAQVSRLLVIKIYQSSVLNIKGSCDTFVCEIPLHRPDEFINDSLVGEE